MRRHAFGRFVLRGGGRVAILDPLHRAEMGFRPRCSPRLGSSTSALKRMRSRLVQQQSNHSDYFCGRGLAVNGPHSAPARHLASDRAEGMEARAQQNGDVLPRSHALQQKNNSRTLPLSTQPSEGYHAPTGAASRKTAPNGDQRELFRAMKVCAKHGILCSPLRGRCIDDVSLTAD